MNEKMYILEGDFFLSTERDHFNNPVQTWIMRARKKGEFAVPITVVNEEQAKNLYVNGMEWLFKD